MSIIFAVYKDNNLPWVGRKVDQGKSLEGCVCTTPWLKNRGPYSSQKTVQKGGKLQNCLQGENCKVCTSSLTGTHSRGVYTTEQKWHGSDKNWNGSNSFCKETVKFYPFRVGSTGAYGPVTERINLHCFFAKTIGTVPVFVGSVLFLLCRVNARRVWVH